MVVKIVTDSTSDIPPEIARSLEIAIRRKDQNKESLLFTFPKGKPPGNFFFQTDDQTEKRHRETKT